MPSHDFKSIPIVPKSEDLVNYVLSATQRRGPTVIHSRAQIGRHRDFYVRKVKTLNQNIHDKLGEIVAKFPDVRTLHKFYSTLIDIMYGKDEYQMSLNHLKKMKDKCSSISKEYLRVLKKADNANRCKSIKISAFGNMVKMLKKADTKNAMEYLETCRQHLARLPTIETKARTVIMCGYPNVGKSSFMNNVSRADVDVQSYAFTTKSLFVGHSNYNNLRWQFIDTPGLLDRSPSESTQAEKLAINALDQLEGAGLIYLIDISEECGYTLEAQLKLLEHIRELFNTKKIVIGLNKVDKVSYDSLTEDHKKALENLKKEIPIYELSTKTGDGVMEVRNAICDEILKERVAQKLITEDISKNSRFHVIKPKNAESNTDTLKHVPKAVLERLEAQSKIAKENPEALKRMTLLDKQRMLGNKFQVNVRDEWDIKNPEDRYCTIPEIYNGMNIADFGNIDVKELEKWESQIEMEKKSGLHDLYVEPLSEKKQALCKKIYEAEALRKLENAERMNRGTGRKSRKRNFEEIQEKMENLGVTIDDDAKGLTESVNKTANKSAKRTKVTISKARAESIARTHPSRSRSRLGIKDDKMAEKAEKLRHNELRKRNKGVAAKQGEADHFKTPKLTKHLNCGKRGLGTANHR